MKKHINVVSSTFLALGLAACASGDATQDASTFSFSKAGGGLKGAYNSAGFSSAEVQTEISKACTGREITSYTESPRGDGLVGFSALCRLSYFGNASSYVVERTSFGIVHSESNFSLFDQSHDMVRP
jgi:hypothetical protein